MRQESSRKTNREGDFGKKAREHCTVPISGTCYTCGKSGEVTAIVTSDMWQERQVPLFSSPVDRLQQRLEVVGQQDLHCLGPVSPY